MVNPKSPKKNSEVLGESAPSDKDVAHWFFYTPCAGVTYYSFESRPTRKDKLQPIASDDTRVGIP